MTTHGEQRLGMLTSSVASVIMRGNQDAWTTLRGHLWTDTAGMFDGQTTGSRAWGHEQEAAGVAKFWERHVEIVGVEPGKFQVYRCEGILDGKIGSSPDRICKDDSGHRFGLEIKSPTCVENMPKHALAAHMDQCQHGMLVTGLRRWYLVVHFAGEYKEFLIGADESWQKRYLERAEVFYRFCYEDKPVKRRRLSVTDLPEE